MGQGFKLIGKIIAFAAFLDGSMQKAKFRKPFRIRKIERVKN